MQFKENRRLAWCVLGACVVGSIFGLGGYSIAREQHRLENVFNQGVDRGETTRHSMDAYLDRAANCARVMGSEVQLLLDADNATAQEMIDLAGAISDGNDLNARYMAYSTLQKDADLLYSAVYGAELSDSQRKAFKRAYDDFWGSDKYIRSDPYRAMASKYNSDISGFPAELVASLWHVDELSSFGG